MYAEIETYVPIKEYKCSREYEDGGKFIRDNFIEIENNDPPVQAKFKLSHHNTLSILIISQDYYEIPEGTIRAKGNMYHIFKPNNFRDVQNLYQDKTSLDVA